MKKLGFLGLAATMVMTLAAVQTPVQAKSFRAMIDSAINAYDGRSDYYNQFRYGNPGYGYGYGYGNPYYGYRRSYTGYGYGYGNPYYGYRRSYTGYQYNPYLYGDDWY